MDIIGLFSFIVLLVTTIGWCVLKLLDKPVHKGLSYTIIGSYVITALMFAFDPFEGIWEAFAFILSAANIGLFIQLLRSAWAGNSPVKLLYRSWLGVLLAKAFVDQFLYTDHHIMDNLLDTFGVATFLFLILLLICIGKRNLFAKELTKPVLALSVLMGLSFALAPPIEALAFAIAMVMAGLVEGAIGFVVWRLYVKAFKQSNSYTSAVSSS